MSQMWHDQRRAARIPIVLRARCRSRSGFTDHVVIGNLSAHGCRIDSGALVFKLGQLVVVRPDGLEGLCGQIRWVRGHSAGIAFERPLYAPVAEYLQNRHASFLGTPQIDPVTAHRMRYAA